MEGNWLCYWQSFAELKENSFSSYYYTVKKFGEKQVQEIVRSVISVEENNEGVVDMKALEGIRVNSIN